MTNRSVRLSTCYGEKGERRCMRVVKRRNAGGGNKCNKIEHCYKINEMMGILNYENEMSHDGKSFSLSHQYCFR